MNLTNSQEVADKKFYDWFIKKGFKNKPIFRQGGVAGTGKTTLLKFLVEKYNLTPNVCMVMSYTGQAVSILRQKGIYANTIHSSIMHVRETVMRDNDGNVIKRSGIPYVKIEYVPVEFIPSTIKLFIIDESSFLSEWLEKILMRYNVPIYEIGDPLQLPPVAGKQCFHLNNLDYILLEPMRQSLDSEIYDLATRLRTYDTINTSKYRKDVLFAHSKGDMIKTFDRYYQFFKYSDIILTATNKQRDIINGLYRTKVLKTESPYPIRNERMICRKNNRSLALGDYPLTNGTIGRTLSTTSHSQIDRHAGIYYLDFKPDYVEDDYYDNLICDSDFLLAPAGNKPENIYNIGNKMEYAYAITTHLSQGAQFDSVLFMDRNYGNQEYIMRLRYTAVTRAKKKLIYMLE